MTIHSAIARYQRLLGRVGIDEIGQLAYQVGQVYGKPNNPHGAGVEAVALSNVLGCRTQDACEVFLSLLDNNHVLRQRLRDYLASI